MTATIGDTGAAVRSLAFAGTPGALVLIAPRFAAEPPLAREDEASILETAWARIAGRLPDGAVARRVGRSIDAVVAGSRDELIAVARGVIASLIGDRGTARARWQIAMIKIAGDPDRALMCDPGDDLAAREGDVIAWAEPDDRDDWRIAGRYPAVTFEPTLIVRR
ncbi:MAG TPA: hypothetical protein VL463_10020 [Kofleriaceae bacterium]|nr:hypothetical protein [Kofleriaceae bacterium]